MAGEGRFARDLRTVGLSVALAVAFGIIHDSIDVHISPDFYRIFKDAPEAVPLPVWAILIAAEASWWVGALIGVGLCIAADRGFWPPLPLRQVYRWMFLPIAVAALGSVVGGVVGHDTLAGYMPMISREVAELPHSARVRVAVVEGMHEGVYLGGLLGGVIAWRGVSRARSIGHATR
jgi:hypothetical protein